MKPYYYIHRVGVTRGLGEKFNDLKVVSEYAKGLSARLPRDSFEVLQVLSIIQTMTPQTFWVDKATPPCNCKFDKNTCSCCCH